MAQGAVAADGVERQVRASRARPERAPWNGCLIVEPTIERTTDAKVGASAKVQIADAYRICREIARKQAKNFYYAFVALPEAKRNAICAVYAFMRHADDLSDDESVSIAERQSRLAQWLAEWHEAAEGGVAIDPVFVALRDAQKRFE